MAAYGWRCKTYTFVASTKGALPKHYQVKHGTFGHEYSVPCLHLDCPCSFKTWGGLSTHLYRSHNSQETEKCEVEQLWANCVTHFNLVQKTIFSILIHTWKGMKPSSVLLMVVISRPTYVGLHQKSNERRSGVSSPQSCRSRQGTTRAGPMPINRRF